MDNLGIYPLYETTVTTITGENVNVIWGSLIVIPYNYGTNGEKQEGWIIQILIGGADWTNGSNMHFLTRRINYYEGKTLWNKII